jgi:hypothetical protein
MKIQQMAMENETAMTGGRGFVETTDYGAWPEISQKCRFFPLGGLVPAVNQIYDAKTVPHRTELLVKLMPLFE